MYVQRIQLENYGPIDKIDIAFPFNENGNPKPVVLVGENGSGKSVLLSHIVNGLVAAKNSVYPETPELETGKVFKMRAPSYIKLGGEYCFGKVNYENDLYIGEIMTRFHKQQEQDPPDGFPEDARSIWDDMEQGKSNSLASNMIRPKTLIPPLLSFSNESKIQDAFSQNCVLYFPHNRSEEPAWLNEENLNFHARPLDTKRVIGETTRKVINYSILQDNLNWLFSVVYDRQVLAFNQIVDARGANAVQVVTNAVPDHSWNAVSLYDIANQIIGFVTKQSNARIGIGHRQNRLLSIETVSSDQLIPNIFQMSSGETSLLNIFLSILRDFDLCGAPFSSATDIRGIVVVDEIDLHLHAIHQHEILPQLIKMFPKVQFVITTHSPLFVLGMRDWFGEDGFALHRLPQGQRISPEEFSEFGDAYRALTATDKFTADIRTAVEDAQKHIVFVEGKTDVKYIEKAMQLLGRDDLAQRVDMRKVGGKDKLRKIWNAYISITEILPSLVILLYDCDEKGSPFADKGNLFRRVIPMQTANPIEKGIENLFSRETLQKAICHEKAFIDITPGYTKSERGKDVSVPEKWEVNKDEKTNLCNWLCDHGTADDFRRFNEVFDLLDEILPSFPR